MKNSLVVKLFFLFFCINASFANNQESNSYVKSWREYKSTPVSRTLYKSTEEIRDEGLTYLNSLREKVSLSPLISNSYLERASQAHSLYLQANNQTGHYESSSYTDFYGITPSDRANKAGYLSRDILENLSIGEKDINESIDDLFSAIYHRLGFLDFRVDEIGIGYTNSTTGGYYNYDMGISQLNELCYGTSYDGYGYYYYGVCKDSDFKIESQLYDETKNQNALNNPDYVIWPYSGESEVTPVFYEESPDPLPSQSVSGYPISISFNPSKYTNMPTLLSFKLYEEKSDTLVSDTMILSKESDPNHHLDESQYALFPLQRLKWGKSYKVELSYKDNDLNETRYISWNFTTKRLDKPYYIIDTDNLLQNYAVLPGKEYIFYIPPKNGQNITIEQYSYYTNPPSITNIDLNSYRITIDGEVGKSATFNLSNGYSFTLLLSDKDSANPPQTVTDTAKSYVTLHIKEGWQLLSLPNPKDENVTILNDAVIAWKWDANTQKWSGWSSDTSTIRLLNEHNISTFYTISKDDGFWVKSDKSFDINLTKSTDSSATLPTLYNGWNLIGLQKDTNLSNLLESYSNQNIAYIFLYRDGKWHSYGKNFNGSIYQIYPKIESIYKDEGVWIYIPYL